MNTKPYKLNCGSLIVVQLHSITCYLSLPRLAFKISHSKTLSTLKLRFFIMDKRVSAHKALGSVIPK